MIIILLHQGEGAPQGRMRGVLDFRKNQTGRNNCSYCTVIYSAFTVPAFTVILPVFVVVQLFV